MRWTGVLRLLFTVVTAGSLGKHSRAEWNATEEPANGGVLCGPHGNGSQCTGVSDSAGWSGHFSKCPKEFRHFCVHGRCRFVAEQNMPSCVCKQGYTGSRCQYVNFGRQTGDQRQIIIACIVTALIFLILLIIFLCIYLHRRNLGRRRKGNEPAKKEEAEKLKMEAVGDSGESVPGNTEMSDTNAV